MMAGAGEGVAPREGVAVGGVALDSYKSKLIALLTKIYTTNMLHPGEINPSATPPAPPLLRII